MKYLWTFTIMLQVFSIDNRIVSVKYETAAPTEEQDESEERIIIDKKILSFDELDDKSSERSELEYEEDLKRPCTIMIVSNINNPSMQSLLRKYRYDANGVLIPSSVKYYVKRPQGLRTTPVLVPLNDKAFSPHGGFVRYYKEVPPIPRVW